MIPVSRDPNISSVTLLFDDRGRFDQSTCCAFAGRDGSNVSISASGLSVLGEGYYYFCGK